MSTNNPRAFTRNLISRIPVSKIPVSRLSISRIPFLAAHARSTASALAQGRGPAAQRVPAVVLALAAVGVAVAPLATSGAGDAQAAAAVKPTAVTSTANPGAAASKAPATTDSTTTTTKTESAAPQAAATTETKAASPYASVSMGEISPTSSQGSQTRFHTSSTQWSNAAVIVQASENLGLKPYAATIAVATALQESKLENLHVAVDHDSLGLFQQRPSTGWGSPSELTDTVYASKAFLNSLPSNYENMSLHTAAQDVQRSFNGSLYSQWQDQAAYMVYTIMHQQ
ncbi:hypothetical protein KDL01_38185 [Actinospica durhamensis]|uniref:Transglycosylase SLT domain-containing protein n=1 Tax=Actinospica durhamensis TaxID=1508375 RepID=A0A941EWJ6_9ACTN|nr:hypothetical protein [Actinospica durhamensis]MBR7839155.1 hypothetical protein [Actinospica durhamensis]